MRTPMDMDEEIRAVNLRHDTGSWESGTVEEMHVETIEQLKFFGKVGSATFPSDPTSPYRCTVPIYRFPGC